jgi:hypothetical protein
MREFKGKFKVGDEELVLSFRGSWAYLKHAVMVFSGDGSAAVINAIYDKRFNVVADEILKFYREKTTARFACPDCGDPLYGVDLKILKSIRVLGSASVKPDSGELDDIDSEDEGDVVDYVTEEVTCSKCHHVFKYNNQSGILEDAVKVGIGHE